MDIRDLLTDRGIRFWLDYGALLGAVRDGQLVAWDVDVDFGIMAEDVPLVLALAETIRARGHQVDAGEPLCLRVTYSTVNELHLDLYQWTEHDGLLSHTGAPGWDWPGSAGTESFPTSYLESMTTVWLGGEPFPAPSPPERFLAEHRYGSRWREPTRPVRVPGRAPAIRPEDMSDQVRDLLEALVEAEEMADAATADHLFGHTELWRRWVDSGAPLRCDPAMVSLVEARHGPPGSDVSRQLAETLAILLQGLGEESNPITTMRCHGRRLSRLGRRARLMLISRPGRRETNASNRFQG
ncbi:MAG: LicD family protein [Acidimicrobiales bacterium]